MLSDKIFVNMYKKAIGEAAAKKMLSEIRDSLKKNEKPSKVYLNEFGAEVHVNGDVVASLSKGETLIEKIARFNRLEEQVAAIRFAQQNGMLPPFDDFEEDVNDFSLLDDVEIIDEFGDKHISVAQPAQAGNVTGSAGDASDGVSKVAGDEPALASSSSDDGAMVSEPQASVNEK